MTDFQIATASLIIILEVFPLEQEGDLTVLHCMRQRVVEVKFWDRLGGLSTIERRLKDGFCETFRHPAYDDGGNPTQPRFPSEVDSFFAAMRGCETSGDKESAARAALPILRRLLAES